MELLGKVAIITGGAKGLGRETVHLFVSEGARVVIADLDEQEGGKLAVSLGESVRFKRTDMSSADEVQALVDYTVSEFGGLHIMYNNAGVSSAMKRLIDDDFSDFHRVMNINVLGTLMGTQKAAQHMAKAGGGSIITTSSTAGLLASFGQIAYRASKAAIAHVTKVAAIELAEHGIRVNCIIPGQVDTGIIGKAFGAGVEPDRQKDLEDEIYRAMMGYQALKRRGMPGDVAQAALFLASERSAYITGMLMPVDGGITAGDPVNHLDDILRIREKFLRS